MRERQRLTPAFALASAGWISLAIATAAVAAEVKPAGEFMAKATVDTATGARSLTLKVVVQRPLTLEQAQPLKKALEQGGQQGLLNAIRGANRGYFDLGGIVYPIDLVVAEPLKDGFEYVVVTGRALRYEESSQGHESLDYPFSVAVFAAPGFGSGEGHIYTKAALSIDAGGHVHVDQYGGQPGTLADVKRR
jgi:hypothetical protein